MGIITRHCLYRPNANTVFPRRGLLRANAFGGGEYRRALCARLASGAKLRKSPARRPHGDGAYFAFHWLAEEELYSYPAEQELFGTGKEKPAASKQSCRFAAAGS